MTREVVIRGHVLQEHDVECPDCNDPMTLRESIHQERPPFYYCWNCGVSHNAKWDGAPAGFVGDKETRAARKRAHATFDLLWKRHRMSRRAAYRWMRQVMNLDDDTGHIACFTKEQCEELIVRVKRALPGGSNAR